MKMLYKISFVTFLVPIIIVQCAKVPMSKKSNLILINDDNWRDLLNGDWMIAFYSTATWCPACKEMQKPWNAFADWSKGTNLKVASVDVSENPGLSGRFLVTALPTIYHVKDGVFRTYGGVKDKDDFIKFIKDKQWTTAEVLPSWCYPDSTQMSVIAWFFKFSMSARDFHNRLVERHGIPSWASYSLFGLATLVLGCILGFIMVLIIDCFIPSGRGSKKKQQPQQQQQASGKKDKKGKKQEKQTKQQEKEKEKEKDKSKDKKSDDDFSDIDKDGLGTQSEGEQSGTDGKPRQRKKEDEKKVLANGAQQKSPASGKKK